MFMFLDDKSGERCQVSKGAYFAPMFKLQDAVVIAIETDIACTKTATIITWY
jgi:hypothetical protein